MVNRKREIMLRFRVTPEERSMIENRMKQLGTTNMAAYLRKIAIDGYVVKLDLPELHEAVRLMGSLSNNVNQIARRLNERGSIFETEMDDIKDQQKELRTILSSILHRLDQIQH